MSKATTKATQAEAVTQAAPEPELHGIERFHALPDESVFIGSSGLAHINAAMLAITTCADLLTHREIERTGEKEPCSMVTHGLLAAIHSAATLAKMVANDGLDYDLTIKLKGKQSKELESAAVRANWEAFKEGGRA